jgi:hypothetical protein
MKPKEVAGWEMRWLLSAAASCWLFETRDSLPVPDLGEVIGVAVCLCLSDPPAIR